MILLLLVSLWNWIGGWGNGYWVLGLIWCVCVCVCVYIGGSAVAAGELVKKLGGELVEYIFILELDSLKGRNKLDAPVYTLLSRGVGGW